MAQGCLYSLFAYFANSTRLPAFPRFITLIFSWSASLEVILWCNEKGLLNQHLFKVTPHKNTSKAFLYLALRASLPIFNNVTTGATMKHIKHKELKFVKVPIPNKNILEQFEDSVGRMLNQIIALNKQIKQLKEARDILLPRLMTGMIDVEGME